MELGGEGDGAMVGTVGTAVGPAVSVRYVIVMEM